jgi:hypothetical protein
MQFRWTSIPICSRADTTAFCSDVCAGFTVHLRCSDGCRGSKSVPKVLLEIAPHAHPQHEILTHKSTLVLKMLFSCRSSSICRLGGWFTDLFFPSPLDFVLHESTLEGFCSFFPPNVHETSFFPQYVAPLRNGRINIRPTSSSTTFSMKPTFWLFSHCGC